MALLFTSLPSLFLKTPKFLTVSSFAAPIPSLSFSITPPNPRHSSLRFAYTPSGNPDPLSGRPPKTARGSEPVDASDAATSGISDEWGEKSEPEAPYTRLSEADPVRDDDEWGGADGDGKYVVTENGSAVAIAAAAEDERVGGLKRCLVDTVYRTDFGFRASPEVRAEVSELVNQLEAANPTPAPTEAAGKLDGNWVLVYTAFSELLPLLAVGATPLLKVDRICQVIDTSSLTIENSTILSSPFTTFSFSASASFEVRSPSRIQVQFKEGTLRPPEIKSSVPLPENVDVFGQKINLLPVQHSLNPLLDSLAVISRAISGQPPLKIPIPGDRNQSWLLTTYLDEDFRISRGDGGLFVLVKEGSALLDQ